LSERRLPIYERWTLAAHGTVQRRDSGASICPVATWLLHRRPEFLPFDPDLDRLAALRVRTELTDQLLLQIADRARAKGATLDLWKIASGFDARWFRLQAALFPVVEQWTEVDEPRVVAAKRVALAGSPFEAAWERVNAIPMVPAGWTIEPETDALPVVLLEGLLHRLSARGLRILLRRIRERAPHATVVLDLTGVWGVARAGWSARRLADLGWRVADDLELPYRDALIEPDGTLLCPGMVPVRVMRLEGLE
jgi:O-methyltransferase involved in polyketide biosynthesis